MSSYHTKELIHMAWKASASTLPAYPLHIPAGTRCKPITEGGTAGKFWVDDLSWIKDSPILRHDAEHYGIVLEPDQVEEARST